MNGRSGLWRRKLDGKKANEGDISGRGNLWTNLGVHALHGASSATVPPQVRPDAAVVEDGGGVCVPEA
jgi:hypothetical protein